LELEAKSQKPKGKRKKEGGRRKEPEGLLGLRCKLYNV
jgi:hypothetical protein